MKQFQPEKFRHLTKKAETYGISLSILANVPEKFVHNLICEQQKWRFNDPRCQRIYHVLQAHGWETKIFNEGDFDE